jgi:hypothetical protein
MPAELEAQCGWKCPSYFMKTLEGEQVDNYAKFASRGGHIDEK